MQIKMTLLNYSTSFPDEEERVSREIEIMVGEKRIGLNKFAKEVIGNTLLGLLKSFKHMDSEEEITIRIRPQAPDCGTRALTSGCI